jgi:hypothetical protein
MKNEKNQLNSSCGCEKQSTDPKSSLSSSENDFAFTSFRNYESLCGPESNTINSRQPRSASLADVNTQLSGPDVVLPQYYHDEHSIIPHNYNDLPSVKNGIIVFRDQHHFDKYYNYLESELRKHNQSNRDFDKYLDNIELSIGLTSIRRLTNYAFDQENIKGWETIEEIPEKHFIDDVVLKSILNSHLEMIIQDKYTRIINKHVSITVKRNKDDLIDVIRSLNEDTAKETIERLKSKNIGEVDTDSWIYTDDMSSRSINKNYINIRKHLELYNSNMDTAISLNSIDNTHPKVAQRYESVFIGDDTFARVTNQCSNPYEVEIVNLFVRSLPFGSVIPALVLIDWGDGTSPLMVETPFHLNFRHEYYATPGIKTITLTVYTGTNADWGPPRHVKTIYVTTGCYIGVSRESNWHEAFRSVDKYRLIKGRHWIRQWRNGLGRLRSQIGAESEAYHWEKNFWGKWVYRKYDNANIHQYIWVTRHSSNDCSVSDNFYDKDYTGNSPEDRWRRYKIDSQTTFNGHFGWYEITSQHLLYSQDSHLPATVTIKTKPC